MCGSIWLGLRGGGRKNADAERRFGNSAGPSEPWNGKLVYWVSCGEVGRLCEEEEGVIDSVDHYGYHSTATCGNSLVAKLRLVVSV